MTLQRSKQCSALFFVFLSGRMVDILFILHSNAVLVSLAIIISYHWLLSQVLQLKLFDENGEQSVEFETCVS